MLGAHQWRQRDQKKSLMKILWVKSGGLLPADTGGKRRSLAMLRALADLGHDLRFLALQEDSVGVTPEESADRYAREKIWVPWVAAAKGTPRFYADLLRNFLFSSRPYVLERYESRLWEKKIHEGSEDRDLVVCDFLTPALNFPAEKAGPPRVLFQHNVEAQIWRRMAATARNPISRWYLSRQHARMVRWERKLCGRFDGVIAVSPEDAALMRRDYALKQVLGDVPTGVDTAEFQPPETLASEPVVGFLGSMDWRPNVEGVLWFVREVLPALRRAVPGVRLKIIGRNPTPSIRALAAAHGDIEVTGTVDEVQPHVHGCRVIAVPLLAGGGTRIKIFEAMAMGVPVVSTTIGAEGLPVTSGEHLLLADEAEPLATSTARVLQEATLAQTLAANARRLMEQRFSWRQVAEAFVGHCQKALNSSSGKKS